MVAETFRADPDLDVDIFCPFGELRRLELLETGFERDGGFAGGHGDAGVAGFGGVRVAGMDGLELGLDGVPLGGEVVMEEDGVEREGRLVRGHGTAGEQREPEAGEWGPGERVMGIEEVGGEVGRG